MEKNNKKELLLEAQKNEVEKKHQNTKELCCSVKTAILKLSNKIAELQSEVVYSPEEYQSRLDELKDQYKLKFEKRNILQEAIQEKKELIKQFGERLNFVPKMNDSFSTLIDRDKELRNKNTQLNSITKQIDLSNNISNKWKNKLAMQKDQMDTEVNKIQLHHEKAIASLLNLHNQLLSEKKEQKAKFDTNEACFNEKYLKKNKLQTDIKKKEEEITDFMHNCQEIYNNEIANEHELWKTWKKE